MSVTGASSCSSDNFKFPVQVARAYNISTQRSANAPTSPQSLAPNASSPSQFSALTGTQSSDASGADQVNASTSQRIFNNLVAGKVDSSAAPWVADASAHAPQLATVSGAGSLPLYRRAADRIEAAVGIALGKSLDVKG